MKKVDRASTLAAFRWKLMQMSIDIFIPFRIFE